MRTEQAWFVVRDSSRSYRAKARPTCWAVVQHKQIPDNRSRRTTVRQVLDCGPAQAAT